MYYHHRGDPTIFRLHQLHRAHRNAIQAQLADSGLQDVGNPMLLFLLFHASERESIPSQRQLAERLHVTPATVANSLKSLERGGYVRKESDPADARRNQVYITDRGRRAVTRCVRVFETVDRQTLSGFSPEELERLRGFHQRILDNLSQIGGDRSCCTPHHPHYGKE